MERARPRSDEDLRRELRRIDRRGYKAYKDVAGAWHFPELELHVDHVQGDPFAAPSKLRVRIAQQRAALPPDLFASKLRAITLADFLARELRRAIPRRGSRDPERTGPAGERGGPRRGAGSGRSGLVTIDAGGQAVLERTAVVVDERFVEARLAVGLPAAGRSVLGREAERLLCETLPRIALRGLCWDALDQEAAFRFVTTVENHAALQRQLSERGLVAFVPDGAVLPRESGASDRPLAREVVPFRAPESLRVAMELPNPTDLDDATSTRITGLGIPRGVTLVVGGGYHGKSTLLRALERGVYPHVPGDGREGVASLPSAVKIRAEDGRRVERCDIGAFIGDLPHQRSTRAFSSDDASGSTSQAANIVEALEIGSELLLLDEDTSATNFMVRDARMQALVHRDHEPITPFLDRVRELHQGLGVSTVLVMGGCGDYFDVADTVIEMHEFLPREVTEQARRVAAEHPTRRRVEATRPLERPAARVPEARGIDASRGRREVKIDVRGRDAIGFGSQDLDLRGLEQLVDPSQTRAVGYALWLARERFIDDATPLPRVIDALDALLEREGLDVLDPFRRGDRHPGDFARPRRFEIAAALCRLRSMRFRSG